MKNLLILLLAAAALIGCNDKKKPTFDPLTQLAINAPAPKSKAAPTPPYSMDTIVRYAFGSMYKYNNGVTAKPYGISKHDLANRKFRIGEAQYVVEIDKNGNPKLGFVVTTDIHDWVIVATYREDKPAEWFDTYRSDDLGEPIEKTGRPNGVLDTIAYIPNALIRANEAAIKKAFDEQNYDLCLQLFETAYVFTPITGAEWRALKAKNEQ